MEFDLKNLNKDESIFKRDFNLEGGSSKKIILIGVFFLLVGIGGAIYFFFFSSSTDEETEEASVAQQETLSGNVAKVGETNNSGTGIPTLESGSPRTIEGIDVGGIFIPASLDEEAIEFLKTLKGKGELPIIVEENSLGKSNPFLK